MSAESDSRPELVYLTYFSTATRRFSQFDLKRLLEISRRNNTAKGVTGLLIYRDGYFLQFLEGPVEAVQATFDRIGRDNRHESPQVVGQGQLRERIFPDWSMGYKNLAGINADNTEGYSECMLHAFRPSVDGDPARRLTELFHDLAARAGTLVG
jgi:hypothetical protein